MTKFNPRQSKLAKNTPIISHNNKTGIMKRPDHQDFWTTEECKKKELTGVRQNNMTLEWEFWILGEVVKTVHFSIVAADKTALEKAHFEVFHMGPSNGEFQR